MLFCWRIKLSGSRILPLFIILVLHVICGRLCAWLNGQNLDHNTLTYSKSIVLLSVVGKLSIDAAWSWKCHMIYLFMFSIIVR